MIQKSNKTVIGFSLLDSLYWGAYAVFVGYVATYLLDAGMSNTFLSMVLAAFMVCSFIGSFFWGRTCDAHHTNKNIFLPEFAGTIILSLLIFFGAKWNLWIAAVLYPIFGFFSAPLGSNLDAWMIKRYHKDAGMYGISRACGSFGYAVFALITGLLIQKAGYTVMPLGVILMGAAVIFMAWVMKEEPYEDVEHLEHVDVSGLLKIKPYMYMVVLLFLTGIAAAPVNNMKIVFIKNVGGDVGILGIDAFIGTTMQAVFIYLSGRIKHIPAYVRLTLMSVFVLIEMLLIVTAVNPVMIILSSVMWNASYGVMLPTMREITEETVHGSLKNTAHSMADAAYNSFAGIVALSYSGVVIDLFGARAIALLGLIIIIVPIGMALYAMLKQKRQRI